MKKSNLTFGKDYHLIPSQDPFYFPGQQFSIILGGEELGSLGVVHPKVLNKFGWGHPTATWEIDITILEKYYTQSFN
jgi:phenylalanyl-tRNA synthetase beta chain